MEHIDETRSLQGSESESFYNQHRERSNTILKIEKTRNSHVNITGIRVNRMKDWNIRSTMDLDIFQSHKTSKSVSLNSTSSN
jgi:hypothetical protein